MKWKEKKEDIKRYIEESRKRIAEIEIKRWRGRRKQSEIRRNRGELEDKMKEIEWKLKKKERKDRDKNIIMKEIEERKGKGSCEKDIIREYYI